MARGNNNQNILLIVGGLLTLFVVIRVYLSYLPSYNTKNLSLVVFKLPRTGSTWFTETLNSYPFIYLAKEIMQHDDVGRYSSTEIEEHLIRALQSPVDKLSSKDDWILSSQFLNNYYLTPKAYSSLSVIGMSLNIEHSAGVDWHRISKKVPNLRVVLLLRGNIIKQAVSGYRGRILHKLCGMSNIRTNSDQSTSCAQQLPKHVNWTLADFAENVNNWQKRVYYFNQEAHSTHVPTLDIQYESIQSDEPGVMKKIAEFLNLPKTIITTPETVNNTSASSGYTKRTSEDLSSVLTNFQEISSFLSSHPSCQCLLKLLHTTEAHPVEPLCYNLIDIELKTCPEFQDIPSNKPNLKFFWGTEFVF